MKVQLLKTAAISMVLVMASTAAFAGGHREAMKDPKKMEAFMDKKLDHSTGAEGKEAEIGQAVYDMYKEMGAKVDLSKASPEELGHYINVAIKTMNHNDSYQHQFNDALVKLHLTAVSWAKDMGNYDGLVENDVKTTKFMMKRIGAAIKMTGREDYALKAIFEQTTCFFQLVDDLQWEGKTSVTYTSPFARVLRVSQNVGIFKNLTEEEVHNNYIIPRYMAYADIMGVKLAVSPLGENGEVTVSLVQEDQKVSAVNTLHIN